MKRPGGFDGRGEPDRPGGSGRADSPGHPNSGERAERGGRPESGGRPDDFGSPGRPDSGGETSAAGAPQHRPLRPGVLDRLQGTAATVSASRTDADPGNAETVDLSDIAISDAELAAVGAPAGRRALALPALGRSADPVRAAERRLRAAERQNKRRLKRETRRFTELTRRKRRRLIIAGSTLAGLLLFVVVGAFTPVMAVRDVRVEGTTSVSAEEVQAALSSLTGVPLALVDENEVLHALEAFPLIQRFAVERVPPGTLVVRIEERVPGIALESDGVFKLYDAAGVLVGESSERPEGVPVGADSVRNTASEGFRASAKVVRDMPAGLRSQLAAVSAGSGQDVTFTLGSGVEVFWGNADETKRKSLVLEQMLASLAGRPLSHVDVSSTDSPIFK